MAPEELGFLGRKAEPNLGGALELMPISRVICAYFSPTGGTKRVSLALQNGFIEGIEGFRPQVQSYNFLTPERRREHVPAFSESDLLVLAYPVFYGRMPWAFQEWPELKGNGASAVVVSVYGNRAIEDGERETMAFLRDHGFKVIGGIEAIAEHSLCRTLAQGRPDQADKDELKAMAKEILQFIAKVESSGTEIPSLSFDDTTPLKARAPAVSIPLPFDMDVCRDCKMRCVTMCPCGIIDAESIKVKDECRNDCMNCTACIFVCPHHNRGYTPEVQAALKDKMSKVQAANSTPKAYRLKLPQ